MTILLQLHRILSFYIITLVYSTVLHKTNGFFPKSQNKYILKSNNVLCKVAAIFFFCHSPFPSTLAAPPIFYEPPSLDIHTVRQG